MQFGSVKRRLCCFCLVAMLAVAGPSILGQNFQGSITGTVTNANRWEVVGAHVVLIERSTGRQFETTTNDEGMYAFRNLPAGQYDIHVELKNYRPSDVRTISVAPSESRVFDVVLDVADKALARYHFRDPAWNVWAERSSTLSFRPGNLQRGQDYTLVVNLAALQYRQFEGEGVYSQDSITSFGEWLKRNADIDSADVTIVAIPDQRYLQMLADHVKPFHIDLKKLRDVQERGFSLTQGSPLASLRHGNGEARFSFGIQSFPLRVLPNAPLGNAPLALSIWADGKPIDEVLVNLCVAAKPEDVCPTSSASSGYSLRGVDLSGNQKFPDAALHLIERGSDVVGVFRCNSCTGGGYLSWTIGQQAEGWLANRVSEIVQQLTPPAPQNYFARSGDFLYNLIFPNSRDPDEMSAEKAFGNFFSAARAKGSAEQPSSLFVRLLSNKPNLVLFPIGLMRVPLPDGNKDFLGLSVNIEAPLELQEYSISSDCISNWVLFVPPESDDLPNDLQQARYSARDWIDHMTTACPNCTYTDPTKFSDWLLEDSSSVTLSAGQAVVVLSQYKNNGLFFVNSDNPPSVPSVSIRRRFAAPSFAILDACGTAAPGGSEFIRALNSHGVYSLISTSTAIPGRMGGEFLKIFMELLTKHPEYTISRARYDAVRELANMQTNDKPPKPYYGPQALVFTLVGNGSLKLCPPRQ